MLKKLSPGKKICVLGRLPDNGQGSDALRYMQESGVETSGLKLLSGEQAPEENTRNFSLTDMVFRDLSCDLLHLGHFLTLPKIDDGDGRKILRHARQLGIETSMSMRSGSSERYYAVRAALHYADYFIVSAGDAARLAELDIEKDSLEKIARKLLWHGLRKKVFLYSPQWLACCSRSQFCMLGNYVQQPELWDDAGAQDGFCAGVLTGLSEGWADMKILEFASACAAFRQGSGEMAESAKAVQSYCSNLKRYQKVL